MVRSYDEQKVAASKSKPPSRTAVIAGTGAVLAFTIRAKASSKDEVATKRRRRELTSYMKAKKKRVARAEKARRRTQGREKTSTLKDLQATNRNNDDSSTIVLSTDRMAFRKEPPLNAPGHKTPRSKDSSILSTDVISSTEGSDTSRTTASDEAMEKQAPYEERKNSLEFQRMSNQDLASKYAAIESLEERAFQILLDLGMVEQTNGPSVIA